MTHLPGVTCHLRGRESGADRGMAEMTPTNPCVLYQPEGESAGGSGTFHAGNMKQDWEKEQEAAFLRGQLRSPLTKGLFSFSLAGAIQIRREWGLPRGTESEVGFLSQVLQSLPWQCQCTSLALSLAEFGAEKANHPWLSGAHLGWGGKGVARRGRSPRSPGSSRRWFGCRRGHSNR